MKHPNKLGSHKVVVQRGEYYACPIGDKGFRETEWSKKERAKLVRSHGLQADGTLPGLVQSFAVGMAVQMGRARRRRTVRSRTA